jgi:2-polyprenyl-3-methyl-5-hydroxy-6-metoxy-1,4-benzoquinol methylase
VTGDLHQDEARKYRRVWGDPRYRKQADGDAVVHLAWYGLRMEPGESLIDWGCGSGRPAAEFARRGMNVTGFDIADNCLDPGIDIPLVVGTMWNPPADLSADYGFCTDVLEHIPTEHVRTCLAVIAARCPKGALLQVDTELDISGPAMKPPTRLHLTVWSRECWEGVIREYWPRVDVIKGTFSRWGFLCRP